MKKVFGIATVFIVVFLFSGIYLVHASMAKLWMGKIKSGETLSSPYRGFNVSITYVSADPQNVLVSVNGNIVQEIKKDVRDRDGQIILNFENLYLKLYPLASSGSQSCNHPPCYESTSSWNTSVLAFEVGPTNAPYPYPPYQDIRDWNDRNNGTTNAPYPPYQDIRDWNDRNNGTTNAPYPPYQDARGVNKKVVLVVILILILIAIKIKARK